MDLGVLLDGLYRKHGGVLTASVTQLLGPARLEEAEACVHDAFVAAMQSWPEDGLPDSPPAWLMTVARNRAKDALRRAGRAIDLEDAPDPHAEPATDRLPGELSDDQLAMMFVACHPALPLESRIALTLRTLCGFEVADIARALLAAEDAVEKRLVRARRQLREDRIQFDLPVPLGDRLDAVLRVLYLLFAEGYSAHRGDRAVREDLCHEAIRLTVLLARHPKTASPSVRAVLALMELHASRLRARFDDEGRLVTLAEQDRARWDRDRIGRGLEHLAASASGDDVTEWHLEAGIAACHAVAARFEDTDWSRIVGYYDRLYEANPSPVVALNRAIAIGYARGPARGLREIRRVAEDPRLAGYALLPAATANLLEKLGRLDGARAAYERALELASTDDERVLLRRRLSDLA